MLTSVRDRRIVCTQSKDGRHVAVVDWATATSNNLAVVPAINKAFSNMVDRADRPNRPGRNQRLYLMPMDGACQLEMPELRC